MSLEMTLFKEQWSLQDAAAKIVLYDKGKEKEPTACASVRR